jgi:2-hydroxy-3-keto-5-methylthiopentenyl-1-phosphate phosphatase
MNITCFIDFDGTISVADVGDVMFETFGGAQSTEAVAAYRDGRLSAVECFRKESAACGDFSKGELDAFLDRQLIDPTFSAFVSFCRSRDIRHCIVSDGMDYYIRRILQRHGLGDVPFFSNQLGLVPAANDLVTMVPAFPYTDETCDRCACCKRNHMLSLTADEEIIVYVGEGYSDRCPVRFADIVFAKDELRVFCLQENISCYEYGSFADITERMAQLLDAPKGKHRLRKRRQAAVHRNDAYRGG